MEPALWPTLADAARVFESRGIQFALIGGLAVSLRGQPRMTVDVDLLILADVDQALGLVRELASTPFEPLFAGVEEVVRRSFILPLRHRITGIRVDVAIGMSGFEQKAVGHASPVTIRRAVTALAIGKIGNRRDAGSSLPPLGERARVRVSGTTQSPAPTIPLGLPGRN